ncbi:SPL family radical SAM protein [Anaerosporobacter sp.]|uniref:SPL family radical SAM protein n=1 Tax=Anaerosporobacter sp. TaxID=1872529 RepID=UPI00286F83FF|nr:radical SAM protein [Anaerosporobacter sp.]
MEYIPAKTIITNKKETSWFGTEFNMNIYKGCCHGCIYCDSRSECYHVDNFDTVRAKEHALMIIRDELRRKTKSGVVATGAMSDPYNPFEKELELTRHALELIDAYGFGVAIATKSPLITRDIPILQCIAQHSPVLCKITITTIDDATGKIIEPHVALSSERFEAIRKLREAGIYTGILFMPMLPFITDSNENILGMVQLAKEAGANFIYPSFGVTLRSNQRDHFYQKLDENFPGVKEKYIAKYGLTYQCGIPNAKAKYEKFALACQQNKIYYTMSDIILDYKRAYTCKQMSIFDY